ncbi:hypothetical protein [Dysgonomonas termitidis]|uniref:Uncharacterized protein n=1 Tax=Dysgonomonas termitidis TaxID=1516126 RepID=A0ABV9KWK4_9BACT
METEKIIQEIKEYQDKLNLLITELIINDNDLDISVHSNTKRGKCYYNNKYSKENTKHFGIEIKKNLLYY